MIKFIVGGVIIVLAWALAIIIEFPYWIPFLVTLIVALFILFLVGLEKLRERRAARDLERALSAQAAQQAASARPDLQHDLAEIQAEFQKAIAALKTTKKGGKKALYALPWYTIIGPPGCGKSTALRNSGMQFPYLSASGGGVRGLGGTRNCDWWMTSEAVILDTAGRWTSEDEDRDEWLGFLDLLRRFRPKKPLNGVIAAVSVGDLGGAREEQIGELARRVRDRIDEVQARLQMSLPVYVLFTKCDLIPGFVETFGELPKNERGQVWGFTAPLTRPVGPPSEYFVRGFDQLCGIVEYRALRRMGEDRKIGNRELIYAFPQQLSVLRQNLQEFVHHLFSENVFKETPRLRGIYFTSGTQEGNPIDRVMSRMAEAFGQPQVALPAPQVESKSYFLRDMFTEVVFKDSEVAVRSADEVRRQRNNMILAAAAIFLMAMTIAILPTIAWALNRKFLGETAEVLELTKQRTARPSRAPIAPRLLLEAHTRMREIDEGPGLFQTFGMYPDRIEVPYRNAYLATAQRSVIGPLVMADVAEMDAFGRRCEVGVRPDAEELRSMYRRLKLHLLITQPHGRNEPRELDDEAREFMVSQLVSRWAEATHTARADPNYPVVRELVRYYVDHLDEDRRWLFFPRNRSSVGRVRAVFEQIGDLDMAVEGIVEEVRERGTDMSLQTLIGSEVSMLRARRRVRYAFTRDGWERDVKGMLQNDAPRFFGEYWVLGIPRPPSGPAGDIARRVQMERLKDRYLRKYVEEWRSFIDSIEVEIPHTDQEHYFLLAQLTRGSPMCYSRLIRQVDREVTLERQQARSGGGLPPGVGRAQGRVAERLGARVGGEQNAMDLMGAAQREAERRARAAGLAPPPDMMTPARVREQFLGFIEFAPSVAQATEGTTEATTPAARYEEQLEFLRDALGFKIHGNDVTGYGPRRQTALALAQQLIQERPEEWRPRFRTLLLPPVQGAQPRRPPTPPAVAPAPPPPRETPRRRRRRGRFDAL